MYTYKSLLAALKKRSIVLVLSVSVIALCSAKAFDRANFSGEWKLNEQKSELGQFGGRMASFGANSMKLVYEKAK
ncbi:MAG TPA: hypothetical protein VER36_03025 [Flavisolibacter sp.]|nr:hypothetical protein [Flavisolibacter sp.]